MNKLELMLFAILSVISVMVIFDFTVYVIKSAPKRAYFIKPIWFLGLLSIMAIVYWYMNGMKFI